MKFSNWLYRSWYYMRIGYGTYIAFFIGFFGNLVVIYELAIKQAQDNFPILSSLRLTTFMAIALVVTVPLSVYIGLYHLKRTGAYAAEASVAVEANPYVYRIQPGKEQEVFLPLMILTAKGLEKVMEQQEALTTQEKQEFEAILSKANKLLTGQFVGRPRRKLSVEERLQQAEGETAPR